MKAWSKAWNVYKQKLNTNARYWPISWLNIGFTLKKCSFSNFGRKRKKLEIQCRYNQIYWLGLKDLPVKKRCKKFKTNLLFRTWSIVSKNNPKKCIQEITNNDKLILSLVKTLYFLFGNLLGGSTLSNQTISSVSRELSFQVQISHNSDNTNSFRS